MIQKNDMDKLFDSIFDPNADDTKPATDFDILMNQVFGGSTTVETVEVDQGAKAAYLGLAVATFTSAASLMLA